MCLNDSIATFEERQSARLAKIVRNVTRVPFQNSITTTNLWIPLKIVCEIHCWQSAILGSHRRSVR